MSQYGWDNCPQETKRQIARLVRGLRDRLPGNIVGIYLHGSLAMGCFNPRRSDLDILVVIERRMDRSTKKRTAEMLLHQFGVPHPVEISFLVQKELLNWQYPTPFDFHFSESWRERLQAALAPEKWNQWHEQFELDPDLAAHITIARKRGICLFGVPIAAAIPEVPAEDYLASILNDVRDSFEGQPGEPASALLNICRVYAFMKEGLVYSKKEGGTWALKVMPVEFRPLIETALEVYAGSRTLVGFTAAELRGIMTYLRACLSI